MDFPDHPVATIPNMDAQRLQIEAQAEGLTCSAEPVLTDRIVFEKVEGETVWLTFDEALAASSAAQGKVIAYCS